MAPTYKKSKDVPAAAAAARPSSQATAAVDRDRALLISLGLADEDATESSQSSHPAGGVVGGAAVKAQQPDAMLQGTGSGRIGAFYPSSDDEEPKAAPAANNAFDALRARLEATNSKLLQGRLDEADCEEVQELLLDQQHQITLLLRGQSSLRGSMNNLRRSTKEKDAKTKQLHQQLEQQHGAALKEMEAKLEKAIQQVQQLQQTSRERQRQQTAGLQQSLQSASDDAAQLRSKASDLQAALDGKEQELQQALQAQEALQTQLAQERAAMEGQRASFTKQLQELASHCQEALGQAQAKAAALADAQAESQQLSQQVEEAASLQHSLTALVEQLQEQVKQAATAAQQQQVDSAAQKQDLLAQVAQLQEGLQEAAAAQQRDAGQVQQLEQRCDELTKQLGESQAEVQGLQEQLAAMSTQQASNSVESAGVQQELVAAVQAKADLTVQLEQATETAREWQAKHQQATALVRSLQEQQAALSAEKADTAQQQEALQQQVQELQAQCTQRCGEAQSLQSQLAEAQAAAQAADVQAQEDKAKLAAAETDSQQLHWKIASLQTELQKVQRSSSAAVQQARQEADDARQQLSTLRELTDKQIAKANAAAQQEVQQYRQRWRDEFERRRKLHNQVIELKGNIRVLARIRPMLEKERSASCSEGGSVQEAVRLADEETLLLESANGLREFTFDRVFGPRDGQPQVYEEVSGVVTSILDGYNACIMAYGQTGSGKTWTLEGPADDPGINSRALAELFKVSQERSAEVAYSLSASVLEIYQEQIFDLLTGSKDTGDKLDIKEGPSGLYIPNLRIEAVNSPEDVAAVLQKGKQNRSTFATNMNEHSSRSHLVLSIYAVAKHLTKDTTWSSKLHLIDLAGSERVSRSGAEGDRLKEAASINKSLSALGDVVAALQQRSSHVPYRNSKLTRLLEDSLGGSSKTLLVVNCSPASENVAETKCSLDFATRARKVELGAAVKASEAGSGGGAPGSNPGSSSGRDSPAPGSPSRPSQVHTGGSSGGGAGSSGSGSAAGSPRVSGRYSAGPSELRQTISRRAAAKEDK